MIIWGWKTVFRVIGSGVFSCPTCGADRNYERRKAQRFFTLFFIPLIPLKTVGEFIRCTYCKNDFRDTVLSRPTAAQFTDLLQNTVRAVMVNVLRRGGWDHPAARATAVQEIANAGAIGYTEAVLAQDMQVVPADLAQLLAGLAGQLPDAGREALVTGATRVAAADGPVQPAERAVIDTVGAGLGMSQAHVAGIVGAVAPAAVAGAPGAGGQAQAPAWGTGQAPAQAPAWGSGAGTGAQAPAAGSAGMETMLIPAPKPGSSTGAQDAVPAGGSGMETMLIQAPQPAPATGAQPAVTPQTPPASSGMETMLVQAPQPAPATGAQPAPAWGTGAQDAVPPASSGMETMLVQAPQPAPPTGAQTAVSPQAPVWGTGAQPAVPPQVPAASSGMETMLVQAPQPAPPTGPQPAVPPQAPDWGTAAQDAPPPPSGMETVLIPVPPQQRTIPAPPPTLLDPASARGTIPAPPATLVDTSSGMETMAIPLSQVAQPKPAEPADPAEEPTHVTRPDEGPAGWQYQPPRQP
ncbi:tellurite resistance protein [Catenulispora sp. EB89]|uniref:zinc-ribbon domain-containing protein n=1 Tax=Catenulispora sp. EB89 TaxID=3156257 RepID=UPI003515B0E9